jgi:hypothetical protein
MTKPLTTYPAMYLWINSCHRYAFPNSAGSGWTPTTLPW